MRSDDVGYSLCAAIAHFESVSVKNYVELVRFREIFM